MTSHSASFPATDWSLMRRLATDDNSDARRLNLNDLLTRYLPPMRRFLRQRFELNQDQADEWVQGFITSKVLQTEFLGRADPEQGKFRALLSQALSNYAVDQIRRIKARNANLPQPLAAHDVLGRFGTTESDPAKVFDRHWAEHAIAEALQLTKERLYATKRGPAWEVFSRRLVEPDGRPRDYQTLAAEFAFKTPGQAAIALNSAKRIFRRKLSDVLIEFGAAGRDIPTAIAELKNIFQN